MEKHHPHYKHKCEYWSMGFPWSIMDIEEEVKMLEEYKEALTKELEKINKRLESLKH
jgi:hypothetical protein